jgi:CheY-like chemotaxis protein
MLDIVIRTMIYLGSALMVYNIYGFIRYAREIPIIAMTANVFDEDVERSMEASMNAHLSKPIEPDKLYAEMAARAHRNTK